MYRILIFSIFIVYFFKYILLLNVWYKRNGLNLILHFIWSMYWCHLTHWCHWEAVSNGGFPSDVNHLTCKSHFTGNPLKPVRPRRAAPCQSFSSKALQSQQRGKQSQLYFPSAKTVFKTSLKTGWGSPILQPPGILVQIFSLLERWFWEPVFKLSLPPGEAWPHQCPLFHEGAFSHDTQRKASSKALFFEHRWGW